MSEVMEEEIKRWTARRKSALFVGIIQGKVDGGHCPLPVRPDTDRDRELGRGWQAWYENALRTKPEDKASRPTLGHAVSCMGRQGGLGAAGHQALNDDDPGRGLCRYINRLT
ncbi:hypothetical protein [Stenotrophomonas humi]